MLKSTRAWKKHTTAGSGISDKYELWCLLSITMSINSVVSYITFLIQMKFDKSEFMNIIIIEERYWQFNGKYCPWERPVSLSSEEGQCQPVSPKLLVKCKSFKYTTCKCKGVVWISLADSFCQHCHYSSLQSTVGGMAGGFFWHKYPFFIRCQGKNWPPQCIGCLPSTYMGSFTYYVIADRGGSFRMITVLHRGIPENDYSVPRILGILCP